MSSWVMSMYQADDGVTPFVIAGHTFEYVVNTAPFGIPNQPAGTEIIRLQSDQPGSPIPDGAGLITVISTSVQAAVSLALFPPATLPLTASTYYHALWMDYADPVNKTNLWWGNLFLDPAVQP
jgi:hypothetical protein